MLRNYFPIYYFRKSTHDWTVHCHDDSVAVVDEFAVVSIICSIIPKLEALRLLLLHFEQIDGGLVLSGLACSLPLFGT